MAHGFCKGQTEYLTQQLVTFFGFMFAQAKPSLEATVNVEGSNASWTLPRVLRTKLVKLDALRIAGKLDATRDISLTPVRYL